MGVLDGLFGQVSQAITNHSSADTPGPADEPSDLLSQISGVLGQQTTANNEEVNPGNVRPASEDPYGDPADAEQGQFGNVRPASEDPYGDPADQR